MNCLRDKYRQLIIIFSPHDLLLYVRIEYLLYEQAPNKAIGSNISVYSTHITNFVAPELFKCCKVGKILYP